jgi:hypothetical protein
MGRRAAARRSPAPHPRARQHRRWQQHVRHPARRTPGPARPQHPACPPSRPEDRPPAAVPPPRQPSPAARAGQTALLQHPLDAPGVVAYREHRCSFAPPAGPPRGFAKRSREGPPPNRHAHRVVEHPSPQPEPRYSQHAQLQRRRSALTRSPREAPNSRSPPARGVPHSADHRERPPRHRRALLRRAVHHLRGRRPGRLPDAAAFTPGTGCAGPAVPAGPRARRPPGRVAVMVTSRSGRPAGQPGRLPGRATRPVS